MVGSLVGCLEGCLDGWPVGCRLGCLVGWGVGEGWPLTNVIEYNAKIAIIAACINCNVRLDMVIVVYGCKSRLFIGRE